MTNDELRAIFESHYPLPSGVSWDGDHFSADPLKIGAYSNATIWGHMWRGFRAAAKEFGNVG
jgi:hypothetical protein